MNGIHPSAVAAAIHHQLATAGMAVLKPATGVAPITGLTTTHAHLGIPSEAETTAQLTLAEQHGALLRGVKTVNLGKLKLNECCPTLYNLLF